MCKRNGCFFASPGDGFIAGHGVQHELHLHRPCRSGNSCRLERSIRQRENAHADCDIMITAAPRLRFRSAILAAALLSVIFLTRPAAAGEASGQVWLLSTRSAPVCGDLESGLAAISYWRLGPDQSWLGADSAAFHSGDDQPWPTIVFIHGNRVDADTAVEYGCGIYRHIQETACGRPFRLVIWSWPSERIGRRNRPDVQLKAEWSDVQSYYLARFLGSIRTDVPVSLSAIVSGPGWRPALCNCWPAVRLTAAACRRRSWPSGRRPDGGLTG